MWRVCGTKAKPRVINSTTGAIHEVYPRHIDELLSGQLTPFWDYREYDGSPITVNYGPDGPALDDIHVDITAKCNMQCPHCYQKCGSVAGELSVEDFDHLCSQAAQLGAARIALSGGEALLHSRFNELPAIIAKHGLVFTALFSNGFDMFRARDRTNPWTQLLFSNSPSLGQGLDKLKMIRGIKLNRPVTFSTLTMDGSDIQPIFDTMMDITGENEGQVRWRVGVVRPVGRGTEIKPDLQSVKRAYRELFDKWFPIWQVGSCRFDLQIGFAFRSDFLKYRRIDVYRPTSRCCEYKEGSLCVKWDGRVTPCSMDEHPIGHTANLAEAWARANNTGYRAIPSGSIPACKDCSLRSLCNGGCRLCASEGGCDPVSKMTYEFMDDIMPTLIDYGVKGAA